MKKRNLFLWSLYDFANSVIQINLILYFSQWVIVDNKLPEIWYGSIFALSTLLLLATSPLIGVYTERIPRKLPFIGILSGITALTFLALGVLTVTTLTPNLQIAFLALGLFLIVNYFYQAALVPYNALLPSISKESFLGRSSGWGELANNAGMLAGIFLTLPFVNGKISIFGVPGRAQAFLPAALLFFVLMLPFFLFFREKPKRIIKRASLGLLWQRSIHLLRGLRSMPSMLWFLIGFYFVSDAVRTVNLFFPVYFEKVWGLPDAQKAILAAFSLLAMMAGAIIGGFLADKWGTKRTLLGGVILMSLGFLAIFLFSSLNPITWILIGIEGISWGIYFAVARSMLVLLSPKGQSGEYFGLYNLFERFASVVAPLVWGGTILILSPFGVAGAYRAGGYMLVLLIAVGFLFFLKVKQPTVKRV